MVWITLWHNFSLILFGEEKNANITKALVEDVLGQKIQKIELDKNTELRGEQREDKFGVVDIRAELDGGVQLDIEMQTSENDNFFKRMLLYWSRMYIKTMEKGIDFQTIMETTDLTQEDIQNL